jgi:hypothetical protein
MLSKLHIQYIAGLSIITILLNLLLFTSLSVDFVFLAGNIFVVAITLILFNFCQVKYLHLKERIFIKKIFWFSLFLRIFAVLFYYFLFYYITGTEFDVEAIDALAYDEAARETAASVQVGSFSPASFIVSVGGNFDDSGYVIFLTLIYSIFNNSVIAARIVQAIFSALIDVLVYKVSKEIFDEKTGKLASIITAIFQPLLLYTSIHMKEILMLYFLFLFIYECIRLFKNRTNIVVSVIIIIFSLLALFSFRAVLGLAALVSVFGYIMISGKRIFTFRKFIILLLVGTIVYFLSVNLVILKDTVEKSKRIIGVKTETSGSLGGVSQDAYLSSGQSFAKYAGAGVFMVQSIVLPYPSMVKTNIVFYNQTLQWYFAGGLLIWVFLTYYAYVGIYYSIKNKFREASILIFLIGIYTASLISSMYITSIRYNIVKVVLLIPFVASGIILSNKKIRKNFIRYAILIVVIVLLWNFIKVAGRGLI